MLVSTAVADQSKQTECDPVIDRFHERPHIHGTDFL